MSNASIRFNELGPLIRYLEKAMIKLPRINEEVEVKALWEDYMKLKELQEKVEIFYRDDVEPFYINYRVVELIELRVQCETYFNIL
jgi:hypothetical protein